MLAVQIVADGGRHPVHFVPLMTTAIAFAFAVVIFQRYRRRRSGPHLLWWAAGVFLYGIGTLTESLVTVFGWHPALFRAWYTSGALLGGAPLAQGTVYLLFSRRFANRTAAALMAFVAVAAAFVFLTPLNTALAETYRLSGRVMTWQWVRLFSPFINTYAFIFLVGGAAVSALRFRKHEDTYHRFIGNTLIAIGALLPGIGGTATRMGHVEVLYVTELLGIVLIWLGYWWNVRDPLPRSAPGRRSPTAPHRSAAPPPAS